MHARSTHGDSVREFLRRTTEGAVPWGTVYASPASGGPWRHVRLTVYPPGTTRAERRALHFAHTWPIAGAIIWLILAVALSRVLPPAAGLTAALLVYAAGFWLAARLTRRVRPRVRTLAVASIHSFGEPRVDGDARLLRAVTARLDDLEERRRSGQLNPVQYEAEWWEIYEAIPSSTPGRPSSGPRHWIRRRATGPAHGSGRSRLLSRSKGVAARKADGR